MSVLVKSVLAMGVLFFSSTTAKTSELANRWIENDWLEARKQALSFGSPKPIFVVFR
jgi:hypothetical protein